MQFSYTANNLTDKFSLIKIEDLNVKLETLFPEYEYLIRCNWLTADVIWAQLLNRHQNHLVMVFISISNKFPPQIIYDESQKSHWYNCHDILHFNRNYSKNQSNNIGDKFDCDHDELITVGSKVEFLWSSERSGFRHLYKILIELVDYPSTNLKFENNPNSIQPMVEILMDDIPLHSTILENKQMTSGNWEISDSMLWIDEQNELIYFIGNKESPLEYHLYVLPSNLSSYQNISPVRLSEENFTHTRLVFDPKFKYCIDFQSNVSVPTFSYLHKIVNNNNVSSFHLNLEPLHIFQTIGDDFKLHNSLDYFNTFLPDLSQHMGSSPQIFEYKLKSGELIYGFLFKPDYMKAGIKYPVLLEIYGGPEVQIVTKSFKSKFLTF